MIETNAAKKQLLLQIRQLNGDKTESEHPLQKSSIKPIDDIDSSPYSRGSFFEAFNPNAGQQYKHPIEKKIQEIIAINDEILKDKLNIKVQENQDETGQNEIKFEEGPQHKTSIEYQRQVNHQGTLEMRDIVELDNIDIRNTMQMEQKDNENNNDDSSEDDDDDEEVEEKEQEDQECKATSNNPSKLKNQSKNNHNQRQKLKSTSHSTKSSLNSSSSSIQLEDYFKQDGDKRKDEQMRNVIMDITKFKSYFIRMRFGIFFEFFLAHVLFFIVLGPFSNPIIYKMGKSLPRNLMFWGWNRMFVNQTILYFYFLFIIGFFAAYHTPYVYFQSEIIYLFLGILFRIYTISVKYSTYDPVKIKALKDHSFEPKELVSDFFLRDWRDQKDRIIFEEIYFAQRMYDIDTSWMYIEFMLNPEKETVEKINNNNQILSSFHVQKDIPFMPTPITTTTTQNTPFYAYGIIKLLADTFQQSNAFTIKHAKTTATVYAAIRSLIPTIYKVIHYKASYFSDSHWYEWVISLLVFYLSFQFYFFNSWTLMQGVIDMKRKIFFMEQMAFMISPRKLRNLDVDKLLPTINIFKSNNLKAWQLMRHVCQEYGKRYDMRVQANFAGLALIMVISMVVLIIAYFEIFSLEPSFQIILVVETTCAMIIVMKILYYGAKINSMFDLHDSILNSNKAIVMDIYRMRRRYFCQQFKTHNYLYAKAVSKIKEDVALLNLENPCAHIKEIVDSYGTHIDELKFDKEQNPFKIGSLKITNGMLESGFIGIASIIIALIAKYLSSRLGG